MATHTDFKPTRHMFLNQSWYSLYDYLVKTAKTYVHFDMNVAFSPLLFIQALLYWETIHWPWSRLKRDPRSFQRCGCLDGMSGAGWAMFTIGPCLKLFACLNGEISTSISLVNRIEWDEIRKFPHQTWRDCGSAHGCTRLLLLKLVMEMWTCRGAPLGKKGRIYDELWW